MRLRSTLTLGAMLPSLLFVTAFTADTDACREASSGGDAPVVCETPTWLDCSKAEGGKVHVQTASVGFTTEEPTTSYQAGAGCGRVDEPVFGSTAMSASTQYELHIDGFIETGVDTLEVELWVLGRELTDPVVLEVRAVVDGVSLFGDDQGLDATGAPVSYPTRRFITVTPEPNSTGIATKLVFSIKDIHEAFGLGTNPFGDRQVQLTVNHPHTGDCQPVPPSNNPRCVPGTVGPWVWGALEVPAGILANRADDQLAGTVLSALDTQG